MQQSRLCAMIASRCRWHAVGCLWVATGQSAKKGDMGKLLDGLAWLLGALLRLVLWLFLLGFGVLLLVVALPLLLLGALWALLRGRRVAVPLAAELLRRQMQERMRARGRGWGGRAGRGPGAAAGRGDEVVDVEARDVEVREGQTPNPTLPGDGPSRPPDDPRP